MHKSTDVRLQFTELFVTKLTRGFCAKSAILIYESEKETCKN